MGDALPGGLAQRLMFPQPTTPSVSVQEVAEKRRRGEAFILLDVREPLELTRSNLGEGITLAPMSVLAREGAAALPPSVLNHKEAEIIVMCHHGIRSAQVVAWLRQQGWTNVWNMTGGIDAYTAVDPTIGRY